MLFQKSSYKAIVIKTEWHWLSDRQMGNWISIFKTYSTVYRNLVYEVVIREVMMDFSKWRGNNWLHRKW